MIEPSTRDREPDVIAPAERADEAVESSESGKPSQSHCAALATGAAGIGKRGNLCRSSPAPLPAPRGGAITTRVATMADLPFLDGLQKQFGRALGYFPTKQFEGYIEMGAVLVAEVGGGGSEVGGREREESLPPTTHNPRPTPVGYCISRDRYLKRDELGVVYQLCVAPGHQRGLIGASLLADVFARSAYGCKLYCCWCAQDLAANRFWESMGFVPIAFRAGSSGKRRVHIFWQRRINADDVTTPYWYPCATNGGAIRADRLVFPIPPGTHWTEVQAVAVPVVEGARGEGQGAREGITETKRRALPSSPASSAGPSALATAAISAGGLFFGAPRAARAERPKRIRTEKPKAKVAPQLVAKARELRDRYLEHVNDGRMILGARGKYDVSRALSGRVLMQGHALPSPTAA